MSKEIIIAHDAIQKRISELSREISSDYHGKEPIIVGILNGAVFFFTDLVMKLTIPVKIDFIRAFSYGSSTSSSGSVKMVKDIELPVAGKDILLIEDIVDTGLTLKKIIANVKLKKPASIGVCALIDKAERREESIHLDYCGFKVIEGFLVGYGLDHDEKYRTLPDIYKLA
ncbi:MAG: hypoxanthine phosphoribosyltransferase [Desulfobacteraceae bacterium]|nr:MAG: hypoxanthine phosphoribosyltransferase [Desulfobacteraceae bacterium]